MGTLMGLSLSEVRRSVDEILEFAELRPFARMHLKHYSSGMAARLAYSVAFQRGERRAGARRDPRRGRCRLPEALRGALSPVRAAGHSAIIVSHDPRIISTFCDRALLLEGGRIVMDAPAPDVTARYVASMT